MVPRIRLPALAFVVVALCATSAGAQERRAITGFVRLKGDSQTVIVDAAVEIPQLNAADVTDGQGRFAIGNVPRGSYELRVRKVGYYPAARRITVDSSVQAPAVVELERVTQRLSEVRIAGRSMWVPSRYESAYRRMATEWGDFITRDQIEQRNPWDTKALLQGIPGVYVNQRGVFFGRCPDPKDVKVYINGIMVGGTEENLPTVHPLDIEIMEVYRGGSRIPAEYLQNACAVIAIWTK